MCQHCADHVWPALQAAGIVAGFASRMVPPTKSEGFVAVHTVASEREVRDLLASFGYTGGVTLLTLRLLCVC